MHVIFRQATSCWTRRVIPPSRPLLMVDFRFRTQWISATTTKRGRASASFHVSRYRKTVSQRAAGTFARLCPLPDKLPLRMRVLHVACAERSESPCRAVLLKNSNVELDGEPVTGLETWWRTCRITKRGPSDMSTMFPRTVFCWEDQAQAQRLELSWTIGLIRFVKGPYWNLNLRLSSCART